MGTLLADVRTLNTSPSDHRLFSRAFDVFSRVAKREKNFAIVLAEKWRWMAIADRSTGQTDWIGDAAYGAEYWMLNLNDQSACDRLGATEGFRDSENGSCGYFSLSKPFDPCP
jgi:hypothetical protein